MLVAGTCRGVAAFFGVALLFSGNAFGAPTCVWGEGKGRATVEALTLEEAKQLAIRQARSSAMAQAIGIEVRSDTLTHDFVLAGDFVRTLVRGYIQQEEVLEWTEEKYQPSPGEAPIPILRVTLRACVLPATEKRDPGFKLKISLDKSVYRAGEKARVEVSSTRQALITIYNLTSDDRVMVYGGAGINFPQAIAPQSPLVFPPRGIALTMELPPGQNRTSEAFIVVGAINDGKADLPFLRQGGTDLSLAEFYSALAMVQGQVVEEIVPYSVISR